MPAPILGFYCDPHFVYFQHVDTPMATAKPRVNDCLNVKRGKSMITVMVMLCIK